MPVSPVLDHARCGRSRVRIGFYRDASGNGLIVLVPGIGAILDRFGSDAPFGSPEVIRFGLVSDWVGNYLPWMQPSGQSPIDLIQPDAGSCAGPHHLGQSCIERADVSRCHDSLQVEGLTHPDRKSVV